MSNFRKEGDIVIGGTGRTGGTLISKIDTPIIEITDGSHTVLYQEKKVYQRSDGDWQRQPVREFSGHVDIIIRNPGYKANNYKYESTNIKVGNKNDGYNSPLVFNQTVETYYSLNGKKPKKSKANLYTGKVRLQSNQTSTTTTTVRAVTYINGRKSSESVAEFSILKTGRVVSSPLRKF